MLQDIQICYERACGTDIAIETDVAWVDVITELLISFMSKSSHLLRVISIDVFTKLLPACTAKSISLILDVSDRFIIVQKSSLPPAHNDKMNLNSSLLSILLTDIPKACCVRWRAGE